MCNDDDVLTPLKFHNDRFEADDHISIRFAATVAVIILVVVAGLEVFGKLFRDLLILPQSICVSVT